MPLDFEAKDVRHTITARFVSASLPEARKPYRLKTVFQPELDIHAIASKAAVYNIETDPKVIEEGLTAACAIISYLAADGFVIKTPLFKLGLSLPGEYEGNETGLAEGCRPVVRVRAAAPLRKYVARQARVEITGMDTAEGFIAGALDEQSGLADGTMTIGGLLTIRGRGMKIAGDDAHHALTGLWFEDAAGAGVRAEIVPVNQPRTIKALAPAGLTAGADYTLKIITQHTARHGSTLLREPREIRSLFTLTARA